MASSMAHLGGLGRRGVAELGLLGFLRSASDELVVDGVCACSRGDGVNEVNDDDEDTTTTSTR